MARGQRDRAEPRAGAPLPRRHEGVDRALPARHTLRRSRRAAVPTRAGGVPLARTLPPRSRDQPLHAPEWQASRRGGSPMRGGRTMTRSLVVALGVAIAGLGAAGCGSEATEAAWSKEAAQYAVYATRIPL